MSCLGSVGFARWGATLVLAWASVAALLWPSADVQAREASKQGKQGVAAAKAKAKAKPVAASRATAKSPARASATRGKAVVRASSKRSRGNATAARGTGRGAAAVARARPAEPPKPSLGHAIGLHAVDDALSLQSAVALVVDQRSGEVLFEKNAQAVLPIASISKLMTAMVVLDAQLPLSEMLDISQDDVDTERNTRSRLRTGTRLSRGELMQLALMSSENRAAHALGRHYPGGMASFVEQMNRKAREIGMSNSHFVEPTGLSSDNVSNARDLATLVRTASHYPLIREYSTASELTVDTGYRSVSYRNTNRLVGKPDWDIGLQKTGYISEAGNCVVMQTRIEGRAVVMVLLDARARVARMGDAQRIRNWLERTPRTGIEAEARGLRTISDQRAVQVSRDS
jgi:D-alanyl-D-alanine endopeptidase (penicillin-binding protein 7)